MAKTVPAGDEFGDHGPAIAVLGVELDEEVFLVGGPLLLGDAPLEVVVVAFAALFAVAACDRVLLLHDFGNLAPLLDPSFFVDFLQDLVFLALIASYLCLPYFSLAHVL